MNKLLLIGALLSSACVSSRVMTREELVGPRSAKYTMLRTSAAVVNEAAHGVYDFSVRVCDFDATGREQGCQETLLLSNVTYRPTHRWE